MEISQIESLCDANQHTESTTEPRVSNFQKITTPQGALTCLIGQVPKAAHLRRRRKLRSRIAASQSGFTAYSRFTLSKAIFGLTRDFLSRTRAQTEAIASV